MPSLSSCQAMCAADTQALRRTGVLCEAHGQVLVVGRDDGRNAEACAGEQMEALLHCAQRILPVHDVRERPPVFEARGDARGTVRIVARDASNGTLKCVNLAHEGNM